MLKPIREALETLAGLLDDAIARPQPIPVRVKPPRR